MSYFTYAGHDLYLTTCGLCACTYAVPKVMRDYYYENGGFWKCPNGHSWGYKVGHQTERKEQERIRQERDRLQQQNARLAEEAEAAERERLKAERALKRHKKRAAAGTCPCCQRTFANMARHLKAEHPDFVREQGANVIPLKAASP